MLKEWSFRFKKLGILSKKVMENISSYDEETPIRWIRPRHGEAALNCDVSVTNLGAKAACGGVLRDENGSFILGYAANLGSCSIMAAE